MNREEMNALDRVIDHYGPDELRHYKDAGKPRGHIGESLMALVDYRHNCPPPSPAEEVAKEPTQDSQGPSVIDRDSKVIEWRWAKETIGLVAIELNEAYARMVKEHDGYETPSGALMKTFGRLEEVMQRLGLLNHGDFDSEIPF